MTHNLPTSDYPKWQRVLDNWGKDVIGNEWLKHGGVRVAMNVIEWFRHYTYTPDDKDYWQTAVETFSRKGGDCEDFAIFRMYKLMQCGCPPKALEMLVGVLARGGTHAVLRVQIQRGYALILDNMQEHPIEERLYMRRTGFRKQVGFKLDGVRNYTVKEEMA